MTSKGSENAAYGLSQYYENELIGIAMIIATLVARLYPQYREYREYRAAT